MAREHLPEGQGRSPSSERKRTEEVVAGSSSLVTLAGLIAIVLVILAFFGVARSTMAALTTIVLGIGLLSQGMALSKRRNELRADLLAAGETKAAESVGTGMTVEIIAGTIGIILGVIALFSGAVHSLVSLSVIAFGVALITGGPLTTRLDDVNIAHAREEGVPLESSRKVVRTASGIEVLLGIVAVVLGILALIAFSPGMTVPLIGLLLVGAAVAFSQGILAKRSASLA